MRTLWPKPKQHKHDKGFVMPTIIVLIVLMSIVAYAALVQANNSLNLAYKQAYIQMARVASKAAIDYTKELFDNRTCTTGVNDISSFTGTVLSETDLFSNSRYRVTMSAEVTSSSPDNLEKGVKGTGAVYLPKLSASAQYVFDIRTEILRTYANCKTPDNFAPLLWLDASDTSTLYKSGTSTTTATAATSFGSAGSSTRDTLEERVDNGGQTANSWQSTDLELHTCDSAEFSSSICTTSSTRYLYDGIIFGNVNVPQSSNVTSATIHFECASGGTSGSITHRIRGFYKSASDPHPDLFTSSGSNQLRTPLTTASLRTSTSLNISTNNCPPGQGINLDVTDIVQEIVDNANWNPATGGGRMGFGLVRTAGSGQRKFEKNAIQLSVNYSTATITQASNGDSLSEWRDISGNNFTASLANGFGTAPTRVDNALNGKSVVRFTGGVLGSIVSAINNTNKGLTTFVVMKANSSSANNARFMSFMNTGDSADNSTTTSLVPLSRSGSGDSVLSRYNNSSIATTSGGVNGAAQLFSTFYQDNDIPFIRKNGVQTNYSSNVSPTLNATQVYIGGNRSGTGGSAAGANYMNGDIAEIVVYNKPLTCNEIEVLEEYFRAKWALAGSSWTPNCADPPIL